MRIRSFGATTLNLFLLLAALIDAAGHELLCRDEPAPSGIAAVSPISGAQVTPGDNEPGHECPCCAIGSSRISLGPSSTTEPMLALAEVTAIRPGVPFVEPPSASHPSRGPPLR